MIGATRPSHLDSQQTQPAYVRLCACPSLAAASESRLYRVEVICMANQLKTVRGVVDATAQNASERYGLRIGGSWYDGFGSCPVNRGDEVEVDFVEDDRFRNVQEVRMAEGVAEPRAELDRRIARAVALKCAATLYASGWASAKEVTDLAERLEKWLRAE